MNILKILGIVAGIHVVAFFLMFVNPGCRSTSAAPSRADTLPAPVAAPAAPTAPAATAPADAGPGTAPAVSLNIPSSSPRYAPTRPGSAASEALETAPVSDVTPASTYSVVHGDSLSKIAKKNHTTQADLMKANHLTNSSVLSIGQKLIIPGKAMAAGANAEVPVSGATYTVKPGDTLAAIAHRCGSSTAELKQINSLRSDYVQVGQELKLPSGSTPAAANEATKSPVSATPSGPTSVKTPEGAVTHEVKPGETVGAIARKYHVKTQDLLVANNIADPRKVRAGQVLVIPGGSPAASISTSAAPSTAAKPSPAVKPSPAAPTGAAPATANTDSSTTPPSVTTPDLDSGAKPQGDVPVIKVDDSSETKAP
jgi:LysM repeat protein